MLLYSLERSYYMENIDTNKYCAQKLKKLRISKNLTQKELAEELGITQQQVARYENNRRRFKQTFLFQLAEYFKVSINDFFPSTEATVSEFSKSNPYSKEIQIDDERIIEIKTEKPFEDYSLEEQQKIISDVMDKLYEEKILIKKSEEQ